MISLELISGKVRRRAAYILTHSLKNLLVPVLNPLVALLVVRLASVETWGQFVNLMIVVHLAAQLVAWGNKEFLLREFGFLPSQVGRNWRSSLVTRALLPGGLVALAMLWWLGPARSGLILVWLISIVWSQSLEVLVLYKKDFRVALAVELFGFGGLAAGVFWAGGQVTIEILVVLFSAVNLLKAVVLTGRYRAYAFGSPASGGKFDLAHLGAAFPFFLLGFSGMLQSRIDLYSVSYFLSDVEVGQYQIFSNMLIYLQSLANFILLPFAKNLYRLQQATIDRISRRLFILGLLIIIPALTTLNFVLSRFFAFVLPIPFFIFGGLFVLPIFYYLPTIYALFKEGRQNTVLLVNFGGAAVTLALNLLLLPIMGMLGAVVSIAVGRWAVFGIYWRQSRKLA